MRVVLLTLILVIFFAGCTTRLGSFIQNISNGGNPTPTPNITQTPTIIHNTVPVTNITQPTISPNVTATTTVNVTNSSQNTIAPQPYIPKIYNVNVNQGIGVVSKGG